MDVALKTYKRDFDYSYALGVFPTLELLHAQPGRVLKVLVHSKGATNEGVQKIGEECSRAGLKLETNDRAVDRLAQREDTFAVGVFSKYSSLLEAGKNHLVLVNPADMGNLGAIARTMLGFGVCDLALMRPAADLFNPRAVRASMGAIFHLRCRYFDSFGDYMAEARGHTLYPFMTGGELSLDSTKFQQPYSLIFGNESSGLPPNFHEVGTTITIRHSTQIDSLSLPMAVGIALFEAAKGSC